MKKSKTGLITPEQYPMHIRRLGKETKYMRYMKYRRSISSRELS